MLKIKEIFFYNSGSPLLFNHYHFLLLFTIAFGIFTLFNFSKKKLARNAFLFVFSLFFYYKTSGLYFFILLFSTAIDFYLGLAIAKTSKRSWKKVFLSLSLLSNFGLLVFFKYAYYIVDIINYWFGLNWHVINFMHLFSNEIFASNFAINSIFLPVGISFYTFQTLSYSIDVYRGNIPASKSLLDFGFFVSFFPQLVAGPIVRAKDFLPQIQQEYQLSRTQFGKAIYLIIIGLIKKVVISDYISVNFVDRVFEAPELYSGFSNLMAVYGYALQIYADFSGYSDIAIGLAALLGFSLPINFNSPYKALSITDFWRRWHISLSSWLRDYLYISLGGNRKGNFRTYLHLMITMLLGGLWHGAATKFIWWGGFHGLALIIHKLYTQKFKWSQNPKGFYKLYAQVLTFHFVCFCWVYFRSANMDIVKAMGNQIIYQFEGFQIFEVFRAYWKVFALMIFGFITHFIPTTWKQKAQITFNSWPNLAKVMFLFLVVILCFQSVSSENQPFIYFQF